MAERLVLFYVCVLLVAALVRAIPPFSRFAPDGYVACKPFVALWLGLGFVYLTVWGLLLITDNVFGASAYVQIAAPGLD